MGVIYIMWLRQLKRYTRSKARIFGSLGQPLLYLVALGFGFGPIYQHAGKGNYMNFLSPGVIAMTILFTAIFSGIEIIWDRKFGFLKETLVAPVSRFQLMIGRTLGGATVATLQGLLVFLIVLAFGLRPAHWSSLPYALLFMFLIAIFFTAMGTAIASVVEDMQGFPIIMNFIVMPIFFLSGALFPLDSVPRGLQITAIFNPLAYGVDGLRGAISGMSHFGMAVDFVALSLFTLLFLGIGTYLFSKIEI